MTPYALPQKRLDSISMNSLRPYFSGSAIMLNVAVLGQISLIKIDVECTNECMQMSAQLDVHRI